MWATFSMFTLKLASLFTAFIITLLLKSEMTTDTFGFYSVLLSVVLLLSAFSNFGTNFYIIDKIPKTKNRMNFMTLLELYKLPIILSVFIGGSVSIFFYYKFNVENAALISLAVLFYNLNTINVVILRTKLRNQSSLVCESIIFYVIIFILFVLEHEVNNVWVINCFFLAALLSFMFSFLIVIKLIGLVFFEKSAVLVEVKELFPFMYLSLAEVLMMHLDVLIVSSIFSLSEAGGYFFAKKFLVVFSLAWYVYNYKYTPIISGLFTNPKENSSQIVRIIRKRMLVLLFSIFLGGVILFALSIEMVSTFFNLENLNFNILIIFFLFSLIHILTGPVVSFLNVSGLSGYSAKVVLFGAVVFLVLVWPISSLIGVEGVVISLSLGMLVWKLLGAFIIEKKSGFNILFGRYNEKFSN